MKPFLENSDRITQKSCNRTFGCGSVEAAVGVAVTIAQKSCNRTFGCGSVEASMSACYDPPTLPRCNHTFGCGSVEGGPFSLSGSKSLSCNRTFGCGSIEAIVKNGGGSASDRVVHKTVLFVLYNRPEAQDWRSQKSKGGWFAKHKFAVSHYAS